MKSRRLFIALPVDDRAVKEFIGSIYSDLDKYRSILKTVSQDNLHITMKFLGEVDEEKTAKITEAIRSLETSGNIEYTLKGIGCFPSITAPSVIWSGIDCDIKKMSGLFSQIEEFCSSLGFNKETRSFTPHLSRICRSATGTGTCTSIMRTAVCSNN